MIRAASKKGSGVTPVEITLAPERSRERNIDTSLRWSRIVTTVDVEDLRRGGLIIAETAFVDPGVELDNEAGHVSIRVAFACVTAGDLPTDGSVAIECETIEDVRLLAAGFAALYAKMVDDNIAGHLAPRAAE